MSEQLQSHTETLIQVSDVHFAYGQRRLYEGFGLTVPRGKVTAVMGPSGCGKSTLLNFISGRVKPQAGSVMVDGVDVPRLKRSQLYDLRRRMGMMFQNSALLTDINVYDNVAFPIRQNTDLAESLIRHIVLFKLEMVGLRGARNLMPDELSGGMARRVALARAIALDPMLVMYDEPFTGLDPISKGVIVKLIREVNDALGMTSVVVTHDVEEGCSIADYIYVIGSGRVIGRGTPAEMRNSESHEVRQFMGGLPDGPVAYHYPSDDYRTDLLAGR